MGVNCIFIFQNSEPLMRTESDSMGPSCFWPLNVFTARVLFTGKA